MRNVIMVEAYCTEFTRVFASVRKTAAASISNLITAHRALVARYIDDFDNVRIVGIAAHRELYTLGQNRAFLINATTHGRHFPGNDSLRNVENVLNERVVPRVASDLAKNLIF